jgi:DNA-binding NarL/FixJ family response regulator
VYRPAIQRPRVLLVVSHPGVGAAIETILRLERRFEIRRETKLGDALRTAGAWPADLAVLDEAVLSKGSQIPIAVPALVLATTAADGERAGGALPDFRGWIPKDATSQDVVAAVERLLTPPVGKAAGSLAVFAVGALVVVLVALFAYLAWVAVW